MYFIKYIAPPIGSIFGFSIWNIFLNYKYNHYNNYFSTIKYDLIYSFLGYTMFPITGFYLGMNLKKFNFLPYSCILKK